MLSAVQEQAEGVRVLRRVVEGAWTSPLLLVGPEGVGRRFSVGEAAREFFSGGAADSIHHLQLDRGVHPDYTVIRSDKSIGIDQIRDVLESASFIPMMTPRRFVVIDGADGMTPAASNAFLKTLEEPHESTQFILLAENLSEVLPTIRSRCGLVRYRPLSEGLVVRHLMQHTDDGTKALVYARLSEGSVGRAVQFLASGKIALRDSMVALVEKAVSRDFASLFSEVTAIASGGAKGASDLRLGLRFLDHLLHDLVMIAHDPARLTNLDSADRIRRLRAKISDRSLNNLVAGLKDIRRHQSTPINLGFHVKTYLATAFSE